RLPPSRKLRRAPKPRRSLGEDGSRVMTASGHLDSAAPFPEKATENRAPQETPMSLAALETTVNTAFDARDGISTSTKGEVRDAVDHALELLDKGEARVAEREGSGKWKVNQWLKKAVLLSFRLNDMGQIAGGPGRASWWDKVPSKFEGWGENR